jgi:hypothetical protein
VLGLAALWIAAVGTVALVHLVNEALLLVLLWDRLP